MSSRKRMPSSTRGMCGVPARCATIARLPPQSIPSPAKSGPSSAHSTSYAIAGEQAPAVIDRERRRRRRAEVVGRHRPRERLHSGVRERGQLEPREVAVAHPSLAGRGQRLEIEPVEEPRPAVPAAGGDGEFDAGVGRHPLDRGDALVVGRRKSLPARGAGRIDDDPMARGSTTAPPRARSPRDR